uniref:Putative Cytochrome c oxidase subunit II-like protein n=1 Tax=mine drainage metagenome TaxID=410659 RepID=E6PHY8_9ZZZZ
MGDGPLVLKVFLVVAVIAIGAMLFVALYGARTPLPQSVVNDAGYRIRRLWLGLVLVVAVVAFALTLPFFPYPWATASPGAKHFQVTAAQYAFVMPAVVPVNVPMVFDVTSDDVNHGFGIYAPNGRLFAQVQAMPDYINHLPIEFHVKGHYVVRCLEFCGIGHAYMHGGFDVR